MATQATIMELERNTLKAIGECAAGSILLRHEREVNNGRCASENADCWGTLGINLRRLAEQATKLATVIDVSRGQAGC